ncbi:MAG: glycoside hydrolase family 38 C-terminal domain-containing protein [Lachnospiraceae bacterium]|nr:glycoside hydrolase family 38 C-terminal domain-containing protein [Lachnospiraceae bacterium]
MSSMSIHLERGHVVSPDTEFSVQGKEIETPFYHMTLNEAGQISRLYDKTFDREVLAYGACGNVLQMFEDKPIDYDAWDIDIFYQEKMQEITNLTCFEIRECGPLRLAVHMEWKYMSSTIAQDMILYSRNRRIDFCTKADYHEVHQLLKAVLKNEWDKDSDEAGLLFTFCPCVVSDVIEILKNI